MPDSPSAAAPVPLPAGVVRHILEQAFEGLEEACLLVDSAGRILCSNHPARKLLRAKGRLSGRRMDAVFTDDRVSGLVDSTFSSGHSSVRTIELKLPGEAWRESSLIQFVVTPIDCGSCVLARITLRLDPEAATASQATEHRNIQDPLILLRGPLSIVQGYLENFLDGLITDEPAIRRSLLAMRKNTIQIERVLESLRP